MNGLSLSIFFCVLVSDIFSTVSTAKQPNIVFVVADDYGFRDIGYHGAEFATPNLDKLAAEGVKLEKYYVQPICSPTRSQLMTGRYQCGMTYIGETGMELRERFRQHLNDIRNHTGSPIASHFIGPEHRGKADISVTGLVSCFSDTGIHTGLQHDIIWPSQPYGLPLNLPTVADLLKTVGYSTHAIGKWHLGLYKKEYTPLNRGFDSFYGYWEGGEDYFTYYNCDDVHNRTIHSKKRITKSYSHIDIQSGKRSSNEEWCGYDLRDMNEPVTNMNGTYSTHLYTRKAIDIVNNATTAGKPFFMYLAYQAVHSPMEVPPQYVKPYSFIQNKNRRIYAGMVSAMDEGVGNVTAALKEAGLWENTILIFSTDNGGEVNAGGNNWPLRGYKHTLWEGGVRGIGFVTGPLIGQKGKVTEELMHVSDWFPTIADIVGVKVNGSLKLDGVSQWPMISQGQHSTRTEVLHNIDIWMPLQGKMLYNDTFDTRVRAAIRVGDFKLLTGNPGDGTWYPPPHLGSPKAHVGDNDKNVWLFNVKQDPTETIDLSNVRLDLVRQLLDKLAVYNATAVPPMYPPSDPNCDPKLHGGFWGPWES